MPAYLLIVFIGLFFCGQTAQAIDNPLSQLLANAPSIQTNQDELLAPEQAFQFIASVQDGASLKVQWQIAKGYYLYREKIQLSAAPSEDVQLGSLNIPHGEPKEEEAFGKVEIFHDRLQFIVPLTRRNLQAQSLSLTAQYQGCADRGVCYPPMQTTLTLPLPALSAAPPSLKRVDNAASEQDQIASALKTDSLPVTLMSFFGFGLLLAFTPCIFPMIPILSGIIVGHGNHISSLRAFLLSLSYVIASALMYTVFGILAALFGQNLQASLQNPWAISLFSAVFVVLALSMFGFYNLELPNRLKTKLHNSSVRHQDGSLWGAAIMGALSSLIIGPCVAAPLAGALIYIGQTGDALLGGSALFMLGLGMGFPLLLLGASAGKLLPKAGAWLNATKAVFGVVMLAMAVWLLSRILDPAITLVLWALLCVLPAIYLNALEALPLNASGWRKLSKGLGLVLFFYGLLLIIGFSMGNTNPLKPLQNSIEHNGVNKQTGISFQRVNSLAQLQSRLQQAKENNQLVVLDFYADWCISCKEMEAYTFSDSQVQQALKPFLLLQADVTANNDADKALLAQFNLIGPPAILFFNKNGEQTKNRVIGYQQAAQFLDALARVQHD